MLLVLALVTAASASEREAAQRGLNYIARETVAWQKQNNCFGCHVQGVTLEGLAVGKHNQYDIPEAELKALREFVTVGNTGTRGPGGLSVSTYPGTAKAFAGASFARYDQYIDGKLTDDLLMLGKDLLKQQQEDGSVIGDHPVMPPVATGTLQTTYQAMQTWRQCYARTADDKWLSPLRRSERFIAVTASKWLTRPQAVSVQDISYALMGLVAAGAGPSESTVSSLMRDLASRQAKDGGWAPGQAKPIGANFMDYEHLDPAASNALITGQAVYALRLAGLTEKDETVARGLAFIIARQQKDGSWGKTGAAKAEAVWAVLGLVSVDVMTVSVRGVCDGERVGPGTNVVVEARDNSGGEVKEVTLRIDDLVVKTAKGAELAFALPALKDGKHLIDAVAVNAKGKSSTRRFEVYTGEVFITSLSSEFTGKATQLSARDIGPKEQKGNVRFTVRDASGAELFSKSVQGEQGPASITWNGEGKGGKTHPHGRYVVEVSYVDEKGKVVQSETTSFMHETPAQEKNKYGEIAGALSLGDARGSANTRMELVDDDGNVVQQTWTNESGNYRFKGVDKGNYKVRAVKEGFAPAVAPAPAAAASESKVDMTIR